MTQTHLLLASQPGNEVFINTLYESLPSCFAEIKDEKTGKLCHVIDYEKLRLALGDNVSDEYKEQYQFTWAGKHEAAYEAAKSINKTFRPCVDKSVNWDTTGNLYIEGDYLEALKLPQKQYLGKIKVMYWDPPYNTGNDFVYNDDFASEKKDFQEQSGEVDEFGNKYFRNTESNGRFHSDWCSMIYPRLLVAFNLLRDDGVNFISIGEEEVGNFKNICNEVFGERCFRNTFIARSYDKNLNRQFIGNGLKSFNIGYEYIVCYAKEKFMFHPVFKEASEERKTSGYWKGSWNDADRPTMRYDILGFKPETGQWKWKKEAADEAVKNYQIYEDK